MKRKLWTALVFFCMVFMLNGCGRKGQEETASEPEYKIYYVNKSGTRVVSESCHPESIKKEELLTELLAMLQTDSDNLDYRKAIPSEVTVTSAYISEDQAHVVFDNAYSGLSRMNEILGRAAVVRTLTQIDGVEYVSFYVGEQPLMDALNQPVGRMRASDFIDDLGGDITDYQKAVLTLYFANEAGDKLREETREVVYRNTASMERQVVEQLIKGPKEAGNFAVLPGDTKLLTISTRDGICYVNLDASFMTGSVNTNEVVPIYAIVNSLVELPAVNKVQISINGETSRKYRELVSLDALFERNLDILEESQTEEAGGEEVQ